MLGLNVTPESSNPGTKVIRTKNKIFETHIPPSGLNKEILITYIRNEQMYSPLESI